MTYVLETHSGWHIVNRVSRDTKTRVNEINDDVFLDIEVNN